jgi:hypothetical protein
MIFPVSSSITKYTDDSFPRGALGKFIDVFENPYYLEEKALIVSSQSRFCYFL